MSAIYPQIVRTASRIRGAANIDAEVVWLDQEGVPNFDSLYSRVNDQIATACAFDRSDDVVGPDMQSRWANRLRN